MIAAESLARRHRRLSRILVVPAASTPVGSSVVIGTKMGGGPE